MIEKDFDTLLQFVSEKRGLYNFPLTRETELEKDLKLSGDDAEEFLDNFSKRFNVKITDFNINNFFANEGSLQMYLVVFFRKKPLRKYLLLAVLKML